MTMKGDTRPACASFLYVLNNKVFLQYVKLVSRQYKVNFASLVIETDLVSDA